MQQLSMGDHAGGRRSRTARSPGHGQPFTSEVLFHMCKQGQAAAAAFPRQDPATDEQERTPVIIDRHAAPAASVNVPPAAAR